MSIQVTTMLQPVALEGGWLVLVIGTYDPEFFRLGQAVDVLYEQDGVVAQRIEGFLIEDIDQQPLADAPQELLDFFGLYTKQTALASLVNSYKTGLAIDVPTTFLTLSTDPDLDDFSDLEAVLEEYELEDDLFELEEYDEVDWEVDDDELEDWQK